MIFTPLAFCHSKTFEDLLDLFEVDDAEVIDAATFFGDGDVVSSADIRKVLHEGGPAMLLVDVRDRRVFDGTEKRRPTFDMVFRPAKVRNEAEEGVLAFRELST